jgi:hypothetical protein
VPADTDTDTDTELAEADSCQRGWIRPRNCHLSTSNSRLPVTDCFVVAAITNGVAAITPNDNPMS